MLERDPKLGLCERLGDGAVIVYPLGAMFYGVRLTEAESIKFGSRARNFLGAVMLIVPWVSLVFVITQITSEFSRDAGRWFLHFANMQVFIMLALQRPLRFLAMTPRDAWTSDRPIDRENAGLGIVPRLPTSTIAIGVICTAGLIALAYLYQAWPPPRIDAVKLSAKRIGTVEFAVIAVALLAAALWRNARTARLLARRAASAGGVARAGDPS